MRLVWAACLAATAAPAGATGLPRFPSAFRAALERPVGQRPAATRVPSLGLLNEFRKHGVPVALGGAALRATVQTVRTGHRYLILAPETGAAVELRVAGLERAEGIDHTREVFRTAGPHRIGLRFDEQGVLIVRPGTGGGAGSP